ncbi:hypothetical protein PAXRUDRAFT_312636 [Paxillus rubicundulus Ve08.2h10]|uniref:Uncharacterized protein n=1 Tax=Paxillus rubicundulus Ve08.2h10 TaxID=930991 RepID=A0A0D0D4Z4_9AGAM|nr:hypothetical protein PAXRUDRAFT_312636 [Paxillus rubicundulus Ve08.2h10]
MFDAVDVTLHRFRCHLPVLSEVPSKIPSATSSMSPSQNSTILHALTTIRVVQSRKRPWFWRCFGGRFESRFGIREIPKTVLNSDIPRFEVGFWAFWTSVLASSSRSFKHYHS